MATETAASDHASITDEQYVKKEKDEAIAQKIADLANEDEDKHDKREDAQEQATPSSKTEEDEVKGKLAAVEAEKSDDSPVLEASAEDGLKHDKVEDAISPADPLIKGDGEKAETAVAVEKTEDSVPLDGSVAVAENLKEEKELVPDSETTSVTEPVHDVVECQPDEPPPSSESVVLETPQHLEKERVETDEDKQSKTADIPEASVETVEKSSNLTEAYPLTESEADVVKEAEVLETSTKEEEKPEPVATQVPEETEEPEKEFKEAEQPSTVAVPEPSAEANEKPTEAIEEKGTEPSAEVLKETTNYETAPTETEKAEPEVISEVEENQKEPEKQSLEQREEEKPDTCSIPESSAETGDSIEEKTRKLEPEVEALKETDNHEAGHTETEKAEPVVTKVDENQSEQEKTFKQEEEEQPKTVVIPETTAEIAEQSGNMVEDHPPKDSDIEVVKEPGNSESEAVPAKEENPEPPCTEVEEKPREQLQVGEEVAETTKEVETKQEIVPETVKSEGTLDDTKKDPILSSKEEKTDKEEETSLTVNAAQVSSNEEAQVAPANLVEPSPEVEEDGKKESSFTDVNEGVSNEAVVSIEAVDVVKIPEETSIDQEAKTDIKEYSAPTGVEEKVAVAANDEKKEPEAPDAPPGSSREVEVESKKVEEQNEVKTAPTEAAERVNVESVKDDSSAVDDKKEGNTDTKVDEISTAVSEPVRETLASKFEEKEEESAETGVDNLEKGQNVEPEKTEVQATQESDATKISKDLPKETPAKPAQKQSNNIISKVKQSLVKAKKAITGKSPSSKNLSSEAKGDIKVK